LGVWGGDFRPPCQGVRRGAGVRYDARPVSREPAPHVEPSACTACFRCVEECPTGAARRGEGHATIEPGCCVACGHCGIVCNYGAVRTEAGAFVPWTRPELDPEAVRALIVGQRSIRRFRPEPVEPELLAEILAVADHAATASNARDVAAIVLRGDRVRAVAAEINAYYAGLLRLLDCPVVRLALWLTPARAYLRSPKKIARMREDVASFARGRDWLFFDAPAVVILTTPRRHRRFGRVNATIAGDQQKLYAAARGLGSCWIGYAEVGLRGRRAARDAAGIPADREPQVVFTLGHPAVSYQRLPARAPLPVTWLGD